MTTDWLVFKRFLIYMLMFPCFSIFTILSTFVANGVEIYFIGSLREIHFEEVHSLAGYYVFRDFA